MRFACGTQQQTQAERTRPNTSPRPLPHTKGESAQSKPRRTSRLAFAESHCRKNTGLRCRHSSEAGNILLSMSPRLRRPIEAGNILLRHERNCRPRLKAGRWPQKRSPRWLQCIAARNSRKSIGPNFQRRVEAGNTHRKRGPSLQLLHSKDCKILSGALNW